MKRVSNLFRLTTTSALLLTAVLALGQTPSPALPTLFLAGDSTAADGTPETIGWGKAFPKYFDPSKIRVSNEARGGRSSRTLVTEGLWQRLLEKLKNNDYVLIQFGQNDGGEINGERIARGSLPGLGGETDEIDNRVTGQRKTVGTFGWYMRKMIYETQERAPSRSCVR
jgi:lysophospholipase L1-like esterase